ncbi:hypothetical protein [Flagellimonas nanhaiensis]|uniref:Uncharacterized protein n=1 Tax=Flagellimonas nanhaiensis TaxID=2292706 RepID=A0A371JML6_9FLAO|nr:hypothetical protein [Allomuricauda nanhaiensis]RDY58383.1 hypothetical protein DX873_15375 [Allomuricauda nanhaiensis]
MLLKIEAEVSGAIIIESGINTFQNPFTIEVRCDSENGKHYIGLTKRVKDYHMFLPKLEVSGKKVKSAVFFEENFLEESVQILRHLEAFGSMDLSIERIQWESCSIEWIPESEKEAGELHIREYKQEFSYSSKQTILTEEWIRDTLIFRKQLQHLVVPFTFFRIGVNLFHKFQYQESFLNFYMMLEGCYGSGQFKNERMKREFSKSNGLTQAINKVIKKLSNTKDKHYEWLLEVCKKYHKEADISGVIHIMVEIRGNLSHFSLEGPQKFRNPFNQRDFESLAYISMSICAFAAIDMRLQPFRMNNSSS